MSGFLNHAACRRWPLACVALLLVLFCASSEAALPRSLRFEHIGVDQGMPQESVTVLLQDRQGFVWLGSQAGLSRFDGYRMTVFKNDPGDPASIVDNFVMAALEDSDGRLWFGTKGGLVLFDRASQKFTAYADGAGPGDPRSRSVSAIAADGHGGLWLGGAAGLSHFDPFSGRFTSMRQAGADAGPGARVKALATDSFGTLWIGSNAGLGRLPAGATAFELMDTGSVLSLALGAGKLLWVGTEHGLEAWTPGPGAPQRRRLGEADGIAPARIMSLYQDKDGNLWAGTDTDGMKWRDPASGRFVSYRHEPHDVHSLSDNHVSALLVDRGGTLWVGTWYGGVNRVDLAGGGFIRFAHDPLDPDSISNDKVRAIADASGGRLWLGTMGGGLNLLDPASGKVEVLRHDPGNPASLRDDVVTAIAQGRERVWVGTAAGLSWLEPASGTFTHVTLGAEAGANYVQRLLVDRQGDVWVLTRAGLYRLDGGGAVLASWRHDPRDPDSLGDNWGFSLSEDPGGALWIGTDNGLDRFDRASGRFSHFRHDAANPASLRHNRVHALYHSAKGELWIGTAGGLDRLERGADGITRMRFYPLSHARTADPIGAILEDEAGLLWISTTVGLTRLDPISGRYKVYAAQDGLIDSSYFVGSGFRAADGRLYFGGLSGLTAFRPGAIHDNPHSPQVAITDFLVFNRSVLGRRTAAVNLDAAQGVILSPGDSVFSLEFAGLHYADPQRNRYAYQLEGFDRDWVQTDASKRFATYTNLNPGNYVFRVKASNKDGVWSAQATSLMITIMPPFWQTWWFRLLALSLLLGGGYGLMRVRLRALLQQKHQLELQVSTRTAELVLQKESVERQKHEVERQKDTVELAHRNISLLSEIGRKLTAKLDSESIMAMLYQHVDQLMDASVFGIGVYRPERAIIDYPFAIERGSRYAPYVRSMREPNQLAVWCIAHEREVFINDLDLEYSQYIDNLDLTSGAAAMGTLDDGSLPTAPRSLLYVPISVNGRMLGVVTVHSYQCNAYGQTHLDMLRTLAAYVGVAFDNADAYRQLKDTQQQLVAQEKLAALGSLVAGVAHELNTPIGNSLLMASTLQEKTDAIAARFAEQGMRRSELASFIGDSQEASALILRSLGNAADLVNSFKQVAVDQASAQRRRFNLERTIHEVVATMMNQVRKAGHTLELDVPGAIEMISFPGPLGQVLINFINNSLLHAFDGKPGGRMLLAASTPFPELVRITFHDDGGGIAPEHLARIFDPFFTTKLGQGGSGLGLNIAYNIATSLLGGYIRVESTAEQGTTFILDVPLNVNVSVTVE